MRPLRAWVLRFTGMFHRERRDRELAAEMESHLQMHIDDNIRAGMAPKEARRQALIKLGGVESTKESYRERRGIPVLETLRQDVRFGLRMLRKNPGFTAVAILTLAIGIGANAAIFSMVDGFFLRSLPVKDPQQLVWMYTMRQGQYHSISYLDYLDVCHQNTAFSGIIALSRHAALLNIGGETELVKADWVSENYFSGLGVDAALGRTFVAGEDWNSYRVPPVVISHGLWQRRFGAAPDLIGKTVVFSGRDAVILGVAPQWFGGLQRGTTTEVWLPLNAWADGRSLLSREPSDDFELLGRLRPGASLGQARTELNTIAGRLSEAFPATNKGLTFVASAEAGRFRQALIPSFLLLGGVGLVLMICCANVSGMMLARSDARRYEIAVRLALGSGRGRLLRQLLTESTLLTFLGATVGLILASWILRLQPALMPPSPFVMRFDFRLDARALEFTVAVSLLAALISGLVPAIQASRVDLVPALRGEAGGKGRARWWLGARNLFLAGEVAVSLTLLIFAGLFLKSLAFSEQINPGFDTSKNLLIVHVSPSARLDASNREFYLPVVDRVASLPNVKKASYAFRMLLSGSGGGATCEVSIPGVEPPSGQKGFVVKFNSVGRDYFQTVGARILRGRPFDTTVESPEHRSVLIDEMMARRFWPSADPIGRTIVVDGSDYQIIGLVQGGRINDIHEPPEPYIYFPFAQRPAGEGSIIVETAGDPRQLVGAVKREIRAADERVSFLPIQTMKELMGSALWGDRMLFFFIGALGCLGVFLTAVGLYGVVAYLAGRRTHEIGIRVALGAARQDVLALVLRQGLRPALIGIPVGLLMAAASTRLMSSLFYGVSPADPVVFLGSSILVLAIALAASYVPARRATKVDPMVALRYE